MRLLKPSDESSAGASDVAGELDDENEDNSTFGIVCIVVNAIFQLFVVQLILFHSYLASTNTTTWECLSWDKISYLKLWPRKFGSPFNIGFVKNLRLYFCFNLTGDNYFVWRLPKKRPDIVLQKECQKINTMVQLAVQTQMQQQFQKMQLQQNQAPPHNAGDKAGVTNI